MQFRAKARYIRLSPYKLRPLVDVIRGSNVAAALKWLATYPAKKVIPVEKVIESAAANALQEQQLDKSELFIKAIFVDEGPAQKYFKPGAMGRTNIYKKRLSHITVALEPSAQKD